MRGSSPEGAGFVFCGETIPGDDKLKLNQIAPGGCIGDVALLIHVRILRAAGHTKLELVLLLKAQGPHVYVYSFITSLTNSPQGRHCSEATHRPRCTLASCISLSSPPTTLATRTPPLTRRVGVGHENTGANEPSVGKNMAHRAKRAHIP